MFNRLIPGRNCLSCSKVYLLALVAIALVALFAQGCGEESSESETTEAPVIQSEDPTLTEEWVSSRAGSKMGSPTLVRAVTITENGGDSNVTIEVDRPEVCHDGAVVGTMAVFAQNMMGILYNKFPEVANVQILMYGLEQGIVSDDVAMSIMVSRDSAAAIDWFEFDENTMFDLVDELYMHPKIEDSFLLEGALPYDQQT